MRGFRTSGSVGAQPAHLNRSARGVGSSGTWYACRYVLFQAMDERRPGCRRAGGLEMGLTAQAVVSSRPVSGRIRFS